MNFVTCKQIHSDNIHLVSDADFGKEIADCDGLITNIPNVKISIRTADCVPITLNDPINKVVGVVHAGWRGTEKKIVTNAVQLMTIKFNADPKDIIVEIGPAIDKKNYVVRSDVANKFIYVYPEMFEKIGEDQWMFDLVGVNIKQLLSAGIQNENIKNSNISTFNDKNYSSYRRDRKSSGFETSIMLN